MKQLTVLLLSTLNLMNTTCGQVRDAKYGFVGHVIPKYGVVSHVMPKYGVVCHYSHVDRYGTRPLPLSWSCDNPDLQLQENMIISLAIRLPHYDNVMFHRFVAETVQES